MSERQLDTIKLYKSAMRSDLFTGAIVMGLMLGILGYVCIDLYGLKAFLACAGWGAWLASGLYMLKRDHMKMQAADAQTRQRKGGGDGR